MLPGVAMHGIVSRSGKGVYASSDRLYKGAIFGRDSLEVAEDLMTIRPKLVRDVLVTLAVLQGNKSDELNEEELGKIVHEYRNVVVDGHKIDDVSLNIFKELSVKWGGNEQEMAYYGSIDSTPHFIKVLSDYCKIYGYDFLDYKITTKNGQHTNMREVAKLSMTWLVSKLNESRSGLLEYRKKNPKGISNQVWKDSEEFYVYETGESVNHEQPIASIEVQGLAYDALIGASLMFGDDLRLYIEIAKKLRSKTFSSLWDSNKKQFALGLNYDAQGMVKVINTLSANQAALLDSSIFDDLDVDERYEYIESIVNAMFGKEFLTDAGIRSRSLQAADLVDHWDYHGSFVSWPKETYDIAKGLRRQGLPKLARQLENRILNVCMRYKAYPEFVYVDGEGHVLASPPTKKTNGDFIYISGTNQPEHVQAWTLSAVTAIISGRVKNKLKIYKKYKQNERYALLEKNIMSSTKQVNRYFNPVALRLKYPNYRYKIK